MANPVIQLAHSAFSSRISHGTVSQHTKNAQAIGKTWQASVIHLSSGRYESEVSASPGLDQRIDILDKQEMCAYELKVSGKNAHLELYKDAIKVILYNQNNPSKEKITKLVFITEKEYGSRNLQQPMPKAYIEWLRSHLDIEISIEYVG